MHLDMDAFFAAIEQTIHPALKGKPVIVGGTIESRGVVSTCSYEARNYGVHSAMPIRQAYKLCPHAVFIDTSEGKYSYMSMEILDILKAYSPDVEPVSIDEAFADITGIHARYGGPEGAAQAIKLQIKERLDLTASIGIAPNRFVAKMASSYNKPDGLAVIHPDEVKQFLWIQPIGYLWGVGPKSQESFKKIGINTIGDLAHANEVVLRKMFGTMGPGLIRMANGEGDDKVRASHIERSSQSMGHEHTFSKDTNDPDRVLGSLLYLSDRVSRRLRQHEYEGRTITLKARKADLTRVTRAISLSVYVDTQREIYKAAKKLLLENRFLDNPIRLIGVSVSNLRKHRQSRSDDFLIACDPVEKNRSVDRVLDQLRDRYGEEVIFFAGSKII